MADDTTTTLSDKKDEPFKKPVLIGRIGKLPKKAKSEPVPDEKPPEKASELEETEIESASSSLSQDTSKVVITAAYKEPKWSGLCPDGG